jgi:hypothetical protein
MYIFQYFIVQRCVRVEITENNKRKEEIEIMTMKKYSATVISMLTMTMILTMDTNNENSMAIFVLMVYS